jgi:hypothetical protein
MRVARWCGLLSVSKIPQNSHIVRLNLGKICQDLALEKGAKMSKPEGIALCTCKKCSLSKYRHRCLCISVRGLHSFYLRRVRLGIDPPLLQR